MPRESSGPAPAHPRTLIRNARQLITLQGPSGSRCGTVAMNGIDVIRNGALLIHNGVVEEAGPARRVENLAAARGAREIDATGRIVMPAFIDPCAPLATSWIDGKDDGAVLRVTSRRNLEFRTAIAAAERARYGCLTVGSAAPSTADLRSVIRLLRVQRALQSKPLRIRSAVSWPALDGDEFAANWLPAIRRHKLASVIDLRVDNTDSSGESGEAGPLREAAIAVSAAGFAFRLLANRPLQSAELLVALSGGAIAIVSPLQSYQSATSSLAGVGCVRVVPVSGGFGESEPPCTIRGALDAGAAVALTSRRGAPGGSSVNPQFLMHLAVARYGLTAEEAIVALTYNAACSLRLSHVTGSLEPGKYADLLVLDAPDYRELPSRPGNNDVSLAMRAGRVVLQRAPLNPD